MKFATRPELRGSFAAVASSHWLATAVGMAVLERGGNAFDAAASMGFVLQVVEPHQNGPGGEVPMILKRPSDEEPIVVCGQGCMPASATKDRFDSLGLRMIPGTGLLPSVVPGAFDAWMLLLRDFGTLRLEEVLGYVIGYAEKGFPLLDRAIASIVPAVERFTRDWPSSGEIWLQGGCVPRSGQAFRMPAVAETYRRILRESVAAGRDRVEEIEAARRAFYRGFVAEAIDQFYRTEKLVDSSGRRHGGFLSGADMAGYEAKVERPVAYDYHGVRVHKTGPWGQGPVFLQQLALLKNFDLASMDPDGADFIHLLAECAKLAFADRDVFYGDPLFSVVPMETLLSDPYNDLRRRQIGDAASLELRPGDLPGMRDRLSCLLNQAGRDEASGLDAGEPIYSELPREPGDTVHLDVVDGFGNMISATPSGGWLQGSPAIPELGFCISTRGQMCWLDPGLPSSLHPGMRPRTTLSPTLVTRDGEAWLAFGTPGGDQQDQWPLAAFLRHLHHGLSLQEAIDAPLYQSRHFPASFYPRSYELGRLVIEGRFEPEVVAELRRRGHLVSEVGPWAFGRVCMVAKEGNQLKAAASPRLMQAYAIAR